MSVKTRTRKKFCHFRNSHDRHNQSRRSSRLPRAAHVDSVAGRERRWRRQPDRVPDPWYRRLGVAPAADYPGGESAGAVVEAAGAAALPPRDWSVRVFLRAVAT